MKFSGSGRRIELDFVRGIAILLVIFYHFRKPSTGIWLLDGFNWVLNTGGGHGVDLFFVLSGFLVGGLLLKEYKETHALKPGRFLLRRMFKIWPPFYFLLLFHLFSGHHKASGFFWQNVFHHTGVQIR
jgi:peptidoglycan/LPS O-acetylase OafA/YrhL